MKQFPAVIVSNRQISAGFHQITFEWNPAAGDAHPGQFFTIRASRSTVPFLRRPFAFSHFGDGIAGAIYQKRGRATEILAGKSMGDILDVIGPLGNTFEVPEHAKRCILVAGGIGLGPVLFVAQQLRTRGIDIRFLYGARSSEYVPGADIFQGLSARICTDDGSVGHAGSVVECLGRFGDDEFDGSVIFACGPTAMLRGCHKIATDKGLPCYVSMEQVMACGVGACMGCVIRVVSPPGYARVCADGPVFDSKVIEWI